MTDTTEEQSMPASVPALRMEGVRKVYPAGDDEVVALDHVNLTVASDEIVALLGPSGSGKTTLCSVAGALLSPTEGSVEVAVVPGKDGVRMKLTLTNGSREKLSDLRVQNCVMLKMAQGFNAQTNDNKVFAKPYVACRSKDGRRHVITAWEPCHRAWANAPCPCLHSDPKFPDCEPGETKTMHWKAEKTGITPFYCSNFCSALHQEMQGYIEVRPRSSPVAAVQRPDAATVARINEQIAQR